MPRARTATCEPTSERRIAAAPTQQRRTTFRRSPASGASSAEHDDEQRRSATRARRAAGSPRAPSGCRRRGSPGPAISASPLVEVRWRSCSDVRGGADDDDLARARRAGLNLPSRTLTKLSCLHACRAGPGSRSRCCRRRAPSIGAPVGSRAAAMSGTTRARPCRTLHVADLAVGVGREAGAAGHASARRRAPRRRRRSRSSRPTATSVVASTILPSGRLDGVGERPVGLLGSPLASVNCTS